MTIKNKTNRKLKKLLNKKKIRAGGGGTGIKTQDLGGQSKRFPGFQASLVYKVKPCLGKTKNKQKKKNPKKKKKNTKNRIVLKIYLFI